MTTSYLSKALSVKSLLRFWVLLELTPKQNFFSLKFHPLFALRGDCLEVRHRTGKSERFIFICFPSKLKECVQVEQAFEDSCEADSYFQNVQCACPLLYFCHHLWHHFLVSLRSPRMALSVPLDRKQVRKSGSSMLKLQWKNIAPHPQYHKLLGKAWNILVCCCSC